MRFAIVDPHGTGLSWARRLYDEDATVLYYVPDKLEKQVGDGIVPKTDSMHALMSWAKEQSATVIYMESGLAKASKKENVPLGSEDFRAAGLTVIGSGAFCDRLEGDRVFGEEIAKAIGVREPITKPFSTVSQSITFAKMQGDTEWYFKTDKYISSDATKGGTGKALVRYLNVVRDKYGDNIPNIMQKKMDGVAISTAAWWNGRVFLRPYEATIEHKKFLNGDLGPSTGCQFNVVWFYENIPKIVKKLNWDALIPIFQKHDAPPGLYDINAIIAFKDGEPYFLEWTPRFGWDSEATSHRLLPNLADFLTKLAEGRLEEVPAKTSPVMAYAVRLSIPPYPWEHNEINKDCVIGTEIHGNDGLWENHFIPYSLSCPENNKLTMAGPNGLVGLSLAVGTQLQKLHDEVIDFAKKLEPGNMCFRTDGADMIREDAKKLSSLDYEIPKGLV